MRETLVIALGGNSITRAGEPGTIPQQFEHTAETLNHLAPLFHSDARIAITHGNGPQIGNILIRVEEGERRVPRLPLDTCVSDSQGGMG
jgi:carbamate kinase